MHEVTQRSFSQESLVFFFFLFFIIMWTKIIREEQQADEATSMEEGGGEAKTIKHTARGVWNPIQWAEHTNTPHNIATYNNGGSAGRRAARRSAAYGHQLIIGRRDKRLVIMWVWGGASTEQERLERQRVVTVT